MPEWSVPWADLMMVMFVLFVVLFVYASKHKDIALIFGRDSTRAAIDEPIDGLIGRISEQRSLLESFRGELALGRAEVLYRSEANGVFVAREPGGRVLAVLHGDLFFDDASDELKPGSQAYLSEIAEIARVSQGQVLLIGHADELERPGPDSFGLSLGRAAAVAKFFMDQAGLEPRRFTVSGMGAYRPEVPSTSLSNSKKNKRVEVIILTDGRAAAGGGA